MAVRNLDAIQRYGNMIAEQKRNEYEMKKDNFWSRIDIIRDTQDDALDAIDTIRALRENGLRNRLDKWDEQQNVHFEGWSGERGQFAIRMDSCEISYDPVTNHVSFSWNAHGMCECYSTKKYMQYNGDRDKERYFISSIYDNNNRTYDKLLTAMAERLQPYLNAFFDWVEKL